MVSNQAAIFHLGTIPRCGRAITSSKPPLPRFAEQEDQRNLNAIDQNYQQRQPAQEPLLISPTATSNYRHRNIGLNMNNTKSLMSETVSCSEISSGVPSLFPKNHHSITDLNQVEEYHVQDKTILHDRSSINSDLSFPSREPTLLEEMRECIANGTFMRRKRKPHGIIKADFSPLNSSKSPNSTDNNDESNASTRKSTNLFSRAKQKKVSLDFTLNTDSESSMENNSVNLSKIKTSKPIFKRPQSKRESVIFSCDESKASLGEVSDVSISPEKSHKVALRSRSRKRMEKYENLVDFSLHGLDTSTKEAIVKEHSEVEQLPTSEPSEDKLNSNASNELDSPASISAVENQSNDSSNINVAVEEVEPGQCIPTRMATDREQSANDAATNLNNTEEGESQMDTSNNELVNFSQTTNLKVTSKQPKTKGASVEFDCDESKETDTGITLSIFREDDLENRPTDHVVQLGNDILNNQSKFGSDLSLTSSETSLIEEMNVSIANGTSMKRKRKPHGFNISSLSKSSKRIDDKDEQNNSTRKSTNLFSRAIQKKVSLNFTLNTDSESSTENDSVNLSKIMTSKPMFKRPQSKRESVNFSCDKSKASLGGVSDVSISPEESRKVALRSRSRKRMEKYENLVDFTMHGLDTSAEEAIVMEHSEIEQLPTSEPSEDKLDSNASNELDSPASISAVENQCKDRSNINVAVELVEPGQCIPTQMATDREQSANDAATNLNNTEEGESQMDTSNKLANLQTTDSKVTSKQQKTKGASVKFDCDESKEIDKGITLHISREDDLENRSTEHLVPLENDILNNQSNEPRTRKSTQFYGDVSGVSKAKIDDESVSEMTPAISATKRIELRSRSRKRLEKHKNLIDFTLSSTLDCDAVVSDSLNDLPSVALHGEDEVIGVVPTSSDPRGDISGVSKAKIDDESVSEMTPVISATKSRVELRSRPTQLNSNESELDSQASISAVENQCKDRSNINVAVELVEPGQCIPTQMATDREQSANDAATNLKNTEEGESQMDTSNNELANLSHTTDSKVTSKQQKTNGASVKFDCDESRETDTGITLPISREDDLENRSTEHLVPLENDILNNQSSLNLSFPVSTTTPFDQNTTSIKNQTFMKRSQRTPVNSSSTNLLKSSNRSDDDNEPRSRKSTQFYGDVSGVSKAKIDDESVSEMTPAISATKRIELRSRSRKRLEKHKNLIDFTLSSTLNCDAVVSDSLNDQPSVALHGEDEVIGVVSTSNDPCGDVSGVSKAKIDDESVSEMTPVISATKSGVELRSRPRKRLEKHKSLIDFTLSSTLDCDAVVSDSVNDHPSVALHVEDEVIGVVSTSNDPREDPDDVKLGPRLNISTKNICNVGKENISPNPVRAERASSPENFADCRNKESISEPQLSTEQPIGDLSDAGVTFCIKDQSLPNSYLGSSSNISLDYSMDISRTASQMKISSLLECEESSLDNSKTPPEANAESTERSIPNIILSKVQDGASNEKLLLKSIEGDAPPIFNTNNEQAVDNDPNSHSPGQTPQSSNLILDETYVITKVLGSDTQPKETTEIEEKSIPNNVPLQSRVYTVREDRALRNEKSILESITDDAAPVLATISEQDIDSDPKSHSLGPTPQLSSSIPAEPYVNTEVVGCMTQPVASAEIMEQSIPNKVLVQSRVYSNVDDGALSNGKSLLKSIEGDAPPVFATDSEQAADDGPKSHSPGPTPQLSNLIPDESFANTEVVGSKTQPEGTAESKNKSIPNKVRSRVYAEGEHGSSSNEKSIIEGDAQPVPNKVLVQSRLYSNVDDGALSNGKSLLKSIEGDAPPVFATDSEQATDDEPKSHSLGPTPQLSSSIPVEPYVNTEVVGAIINVPLATSNVVDAITREHISIPHGTSLRPEVVELNKSQVTSENVNVPLPPEKGAKINMLNCDVDATNNNALPSSAGPLLPNDHLREPGNVVPLSSDSNKFVKQNNVVADVPMDPPTGVKPVDERTSLKKKPKRKTVSFKPVHQNTYHSPPEPHTSDSNQTTTLTKDGGGYEFSRFQVTTEISDIEESVVRVTRSKKHYTSTPIIKRKIRTTSTSNVDLQTVLREAKLDEIITAVPLPKVTPIGNDFLVPAPALNDPKLITSPTGLSPVEPLDAALLSPLEGVKSRVKKRGSLSSRSTSTDLSMEQSLNITAIPRAQTRPKERVYHSTPLRHSDKSKKKSKTRDTSMSPNLRSKSRNLSKISDDQSPQVEADSRTRSSNVNKSSLEPSDQLAQPLTNTSPERVSIEDNTILSTRGYNGARTRDHASTRSSSLTARASISSYNSHYRPSRRLFSDAPDGEEISGKDPESEGPITETVPSASEGAFGEPPDLPVDDRGRNDVSSYSSASSRRSSVDDSIAGSSAVSEIAPSVDLTIPESVVVFTKPKKRRRAVTDSWATKRRKLYKPGKWASKKLYTWLENKLRPAYDLQATQQAERFVIDLQYAISLTSNGHSDEAICLLRERSKDLELCSTELEFWMLIHKWMPFDFKIKVMPLGGAFGTAVRDFTNPYDPI